MSRAASAPSGTLYTPAPVLRSRVGFDWSNYFVVSSADNPPVDFRMSRKAASMSSYLSKMLGEFCSSGTFDADVPAAADEEVVVPVPHVTASALRHVVAFCEHYRTRRPLKIPMPLPRKFEEVLGEWDRAFIFGELIADHDDLGELDGCDEDHGALVDVLMAAGFLDIESLLDLCSAGLAALMQPRTVDQIRDLFGVENDFSREEEERLARDMWADPNEPPPNE